MTTVLQAQITDLQAFYGILPAPPHNPFALFVWEILGMNSTPARRDAALAAMKKARILTPDAVGRAPQKTLEAAMAAAGPYGEQRLHALRAGVAVFRRRPDLADAINGPLPGARRALKPLRLSAAAAHRMLLIAGGHLVLPPDPRLLRVGLRLGYGATAREVRRTLAAALPCRAEAYRQAAVYLTHHGTLTCTERDPHCGVCPLLEGCPWGQAKFKI